MDYHIQNAVQLPLDRNRCWFTYRKGVLKARSTELFILLHVLEKTIAVVIEKKFSKHLTPLTDIRLHII